MAAPGPEQSEIGTLFQEDPFFSSPLAKWMRQKRKPIFYITRDFNGLIIPNMDYDQFLYKR